MGRVVLNVTKQPDEQIATAISLADKWDLIVYGNQGSWTVNGFMTGARCYPPCLLHVIYYCDHTGLFDSTLLLIEALGVSSRGWPASTAEEDQRPPEDSVNLNELIGLLNDHDGSELTRMLVINTT